MSDKQGEWCMVGVCEGECTGCGLGDEPLTLMRCHSLMKSWKGGNSSVAKPITYEHNWKIYFFISFSFTDLLSLIS